jgi:exonuclease V
MKAGTKVHAELEAQVHDVVAVQTESKEDRFALRLWNTVVGLRTLRREGLTRELEVWGTLGGEVVVGVLDEISFQEPGEAEAEAEEAGGGEKKISVSGTQRSIEDYAINKRGDEQNGDGTPSTGRTVYITDVKTRGMKSLPTGASLRPTWIQLMLYKRLLEALARNEVDADTIFARYDLRPLEPFTETFKRSMAVFGDDGSSDDDSEYGNNDDNDAIMSDPPSSAAPPPQSEINTYTTLSSLWSLMISESATTISAISPLLRAEFRYSRTGELLGSHTFTFDANALDAYIKREMEWWRGEREPVGVEEEEAFKCRVCEFAEGCGWRRGKVEEARERARVRREREREKAGLGT